MRLELAASRPCVLQCVDLLANTLSKWDLEEELVRAEKGAIRVQRALVKVDAAKYDGLHCALAFQASQ